PRDPEEFRRRPEGGGAHPGGDDEARRRHANARGGRAAPGPGRHDLLRAAAGRNRGGGRPAGRGRPGRREGRAGRVSRAARVRLITAHRILIGAGIAFFLFYAVVQLLLYARGGGAAPLVLPDGRVLGGADAVPELLRRIRGLGWLAAVFALPGARPLARRVYAWIAKNRMRISCAAPRR